MTNDPWALLVSSIRRRRAPEARFFKPVCVIAAIDLSNEGLLDPARVNADAILSRFHAYVKLSFRARAEMGWKPLWHLSNDGLWTFSNDDIDITRDDFGADRTPGTKAILFNRFDLLTINEPYRTLWLDTEHRQALRRAMLVILANDDEGCRLFARQLFQPELAMQRKEWPSEAEIMEELRLFREQLDLFGEGTGVEIDDASALESDHIEQPFDPEAIDVATRTVTVDLLLSRVSNERIDLMPDFQRRVGLWDQKRQSRLIESLLLRIPLPVLYAAEDEDEKWEIVDGIQRLSTIARFVRPDSINSQPLLLSDLQYLEAYEGKSFNDLSEKLKTRLKETELVVHLIRKGTPPEVKFNVFARINSGGIALSPQELRHAITPGAGRGLLAKWASSEEFLKATDRSVRPIRMDDRELVLRFVAFYSLGVSSYKRADMDGFLIQAMRSLNRLEAPDTERLQSAFDRAMLVAYLIFEGEAFRKRLSPEAARMPINKALFEAVSVNLAKLAEHEGSLLVERRTRVHIEFMALCADRQFEAAISQGTSDVAKVNRRFDMVAEMFQKVVSSA
ncbi:DUF262 domain-containing protein [Mesorhizobium sp. M0614]|uniref:DUF262 domain-containing protein n=1 Tax=Mesorhizobium sp. M0614 TaxID=2956970 RepID=UPI00333A6F56